MYYNDEAGRAAYLAGFHAAEALDLQRGPARELPGAARRLRGGRLAAAVHPEAGWMAAAAGRAQQHHPSTEHLPARRSMAMAAEPPPPHILAATNTHSAIQARFGDDSPFG